ncbi:Outer membrane protein (porin) [Terricaulis silvestris]|uniref:Outer membrane protein (Porin) n=2 Tax=Terricaulis silvestris TaxID=2686094 RepID=A0A6I6MQD1_9CAUL|nr:Outer membrane protein (porin) [Terricaulis silvestris]
MPKCGVGAVASVLAAIFMIGDVRAQPQVEDGGTDYFRRDGNPSVRDRQVERSAELGWRLGGFWLKPQVSLDLGYSDNVAASETDPEASTVYQADVRIDLESNWGRHELHGSLDIPTVNYTSDFSATDVIAELGGRLDIDRGLSVNGGASYGRRTEPYSFLPSGVELSDPLEYDTTGAYVGFAQTFNRVRLAGRASMLERDFHDGELTNGLPFEVDDRDVTQVSYGLRADYAMTARTSLFVSAEANTREHDLVPPAVLVNKDSEGYEVLVGANFDLTHLMSGELGVGYYAQSFDEPGVEEQTGFAARGQIEWYPDELVTVTVGVERAVSEAFAVGARSLVNTDANIGIDYEYRRNIILSVASGYSFEEYGEIDRQDRRWTVYAGGEYEFNRFTSFNARIGHGEQESEGADFGRSYEENVASIGVRLRR